MVEQQRDVVAPFAQRRQLDLDRVEPEQQILAEAALVGQLRRATGWSRRSPGRRSAPGLLAPSGTTCRCSSAVSNLGWRWSGRLPISSRNKVDFVGRLETADALARGAGEGAFDVAEQFGFEQAFARRAEVDRSSSARADRRDRRWISRATISLPVPFSPRIRTLASVGAARSISVRTRCICAEFAEQWRVGALRQVRSPGHARCCASSLLRRSAAALRTVAASRSLAQGLATKSAAPRLIASTAIDTAPCAVMITTAASGSMRHDLAERRRGPRARRSPPRSKLRSSRMTSGDSRLRKSNSAGGCVDRLDPGEQVAQRQPRRERDIGIVVDHHRELEICSSIVTILYAAVRKRTVASVDLSQPRGHISTIWHEPCCEWGMTDSSAHPAFRALAEGHRPQRLSASGQHTVRNRTMSVAEMP